MSKGPKTLTKTSTSSAQVDPALRNRQNELYQQAQGLQFQPYTGDRFAGFNPDQEASFNAARQAAGAGAGTLQGAIGATYGALGEKDPTVEAERIGAERVKAERFTDADINPYMNPWTSGVVDTSLADIERARKEAQAQATAQGLASGSFGGSRSGVAAALTNREFARTAAQTAAQLRAQGYENAAQRIETDQNRQLQAGGMNQSAALQAAQANQSAALQAARATAEAALQGRGLRMGAAGQLAGLAGQEQQQGAFGADLLSRIGGQQQGLDQARRDFAFNEFDAQRNFNPQKIGLLTDMLARGQYGTTTTGSQTEPNPYRGSLTSSLLGLGGLVLGGPIGGAIGKGIGGLFGGSAPAPGIDATGWGRTNV